MSKAASARVNQAQIEISLLKILSHPNICRMIDYFENKEFLFVCREFVAGETLSEHLNNQKEKDGYIDEFEMRTIFKTVVETIEFLHDMGVVVRNLNMDSFIVAETKTDTDSYYQPKMWDLSHMGIVYQGEKTTGQFGPEVYHAPEVVQGSPYDQKADTWAIGVILFTMIIGRLPFSNF
mmetsp:Transcript_9299/g.14068  ORF Transcript_9299/g.14068 Transcript_9299/m.14068 type:complete len:179 (+) Transcript_9299:410-946(+)